MSSTPSLQIINEKQDLDFDLDLDAFPSEPCPHLADFRTYHGAKPFRALQDCLLVKPFGRASIQRDPKEVPLCGRCGVTSPRLYACVACAAVFCRQHGPDHGAAEISHMVAIDIDRAELFCLVCQDQVYDLDFDAAVYGKQRTLYVLKSSLVQTQLKPGYLRKRKRVDYRPWTPDLPERAIMKKHTSPLVNVINGLNSEFPWGLRGLNNLGNTCFMNSVLQALLHTPPLRNYFLSDRHNRYYCKKKWGAGKKNGSIRECNSKGIRLCLACDLDEMYSAVFSGERTSFSPSNFLHSWWQHAANLASYEQQDAHEFFISMLDGIHEKEQSDHPRFQNQGNGDCCVAHRVFSGILRSDVMCSECGFTSTTYDPCVDISLDLESNKKNTTTKVNSSKRNISPNGKAGIKASSPECGTPTLMGCLDRFTRPERLGSSQKFFCQKCQVRQESLKQMSLRKLPLVSCFHIKRFEHSSVRKMSRKIDRYLQFPLSLDMEPYLSSSILRKRFGNRMFPVDSDDSETKSEMSSQFELFAVVTHSGTLDAGHYVTYLRLSDKWYKCDDAWISQVSENIVRTAQGYMMFYVQKTLYYKASERRDVFHNTERDNINKC